MGLKGSPQDLHGNAGHVNETYSWQVPSSYHVTSLWQVSSLRQVKKKSPSNIQTITPSTQPRFQESAHRCPILAMAPMPSPHM